MSDMDVTKLKVVELRAELAERGLDTKGNKPVLIERLEEALEKEKLEVVVDSTSKVTAAAAGGKKAEEDGDEEEEEDEEEASEEEEKTPTPPPQEEEPVEAPEPVVVPVVEPEPAAKSPQKVSSPVKVVEPTPAPVVSESSPVKVSPPVAKEVPSPVAKEVSSPVAKEVSSPVVKEVSSPVAKAVSSPVKKAVLPEPTPEPKPAPPVVKEEPKQPEVKKETPPKVVTPVKVEPPQVKEKPSQASPVKQEKDTEVKKEPAEEPMDVSTKAEPEKEAESRTKSDKSNLRKLDPKLLPKEGESFPVMELSEWDEKPKVEGGGTIEPPERINRKRARSESPEPESISARKVVEEDEPDYDEETHLLSWYDSDLNLKIDKSNYLSAKPMHEEGFAFIWAGARSSFGVSGGLAFYEVKVEEHLDVSHLTNEEYPHVLRVGWSIPTASMQLGEEALSFGYGGTGKVSCNNKFRDYGKPFQSGDIIGAFLDMSGETVRMSFSVNGQDQGVAFEVPRGKLNNQPLFPHVLTKNCCFTCNFGASEPFFPPIDPKYKAVASLSKEDQLVAGPKRPKTKAECEMIMMCGLPGCGKTYWANKYTAKHPEKNFNVLGTNNLIDKMRVMGLNRRRNYHGRWDELIQQCTKCLNHLLGVAAGRRRNYILDQTNVYPTAQRRKMKPFDGFVRRAVVVVPTDDEFKRRVAQREQEEGKDVPDNAVMEMKGNFQLPTKGDIFGEVIFAEQDETEARKIVEQYNKEAEAAGFGVSSPSKRPRGSNHERTSRFTDREDNRGGGRHYGGDRSDNRNRGGWNRDGGNRGGGWNRDNHGGGGGYRGNRDGGSWRGGNRDRDSRSYGGGGGRSDRGGYDRNRSDRGRDHRDRYGGGSGNWSQGGGGNYRSGGYGGYQQQQSAGYGQQAAAAAYQQPAYQQAAAYGAYGGYGQAQAQQYGGYGQQQAYAAWGQQAQQAAAYGTYAQQQPTAQTQATTQGYSQYNFPQQYGSSSSSGTAPK